VNTPASGSPAGDGCANMRARRLKRATVEGDCFYAGNGSADLREEDACDARDGGVSLGFSHGHGFGSGYRRDSDAARGRGKALGPLWDVEGFTSWESIEKAACVVGSVGNAWRADPVYRHDLNALLVLWLLVCLAYNLSHVLISCDLQPALRRRHPIIYLAYEILAELHPRAFPQAPLLPKGYRPRHSLNARRGRNPPFSPCCQGPILPRRTRVRRLCPKNSSRKCPPLQKTTLLNKTSPYGNTVAESPFALPCRCARSRQ